MKTIHSGDVVRIEDEASPYFQREAVVHYVLAHNGCESDPVLTVTVNCAMHTTKAFTIRQSLVSLIDGLKTSM